MQKKFILSVLIISSVFISGCTDSTPSNETSKQTKQELQTKVAAKNNIEPEKTPEQVQADLEKPKQKEISLRWCSNYFEIIDDINEKWKNFSENDSEFVVPMQNLAGSMMTAGDKISNYPEYQIPANAPSGVKDKMQKVISMLQDGMEDLAYSLTVMAECAEEISGSNDLPNRIVIPYGASEQEIYDNMQTVKFRYQNARDKIDSAKILTQEIVNDLNSL